MPTAPSDLELQEFFVREGPRLRGYVAALVGATDATDLVHDAFLRAQRALASCQAATLGSWVRRIARNVAIDHLRRSAANPVSLGSSERESSDEEGSPATAPDPERSVIKREMRGCIADFVQRLPERDAEVIMLSELRGLQDQEVATALQITLGAAKIRLHRARARLRRMMERGCALYRDEDGLACDRKE